MGAHVQAASFRLSTEKIFTPLVTLAILIQQNPSLTQLRQHFPEVARRLMDEVRPGYSSSSSSCDGTRQLHIVDESGTAPVQQQLQQQQQQLSASPAHI
jgi:hypothetical protein